MQRKDKNLHLHCLRLHFPFSFFLISLSSSTMAETTAKTTSWEYVKELLKDDIKSGKVLPSMAPRDIYDLQQEYKGIKYKKFRTNLNNIQKSLKKLSNEALVDSNAVANDCRAHPKNNDGNALYSYPRWDGLEAQRLLKLDVDDGTHERLLPREFHQARVEYQAYPLDVFWKHIHQETRSHRETAYWLVKKQQKKTLNCVDLN